MQKIRINTHDNAHTYTHTHLYIYIYTYVCNVCGFEGDLFDLYPQLTSLHVFLHNFET